MMLLIGFMSIAMALLLAVLCQHACDSRRLIVGVKWMIAAVALLIIREVLAFDMPNELTPEDPGRLVVYFNFAVVLGAPLMLLWAWMVLVDVFAVSSKSPDQPLKLACDQCHKSYDSKWYECPHCLQEQQKQRNEQST